METEGRNADYFSCSVALEMERLLNSSENVVTIPGQSGPVTLRDWKERNGR